MNARPRIVERTSMPPSMRHERASHPRKQCRAIIELDGQPYRCGREHTDGIHDAFADHYDQGAVRW